MEVCLNDAKTLFSLCVMIFVFLAIGALLGHSNTFSNTIVGVGAFEQRSNFNGMTDIASVADGTVNYKADAQWGFDDNSKALPLTFNSSFMVTDAKTVKGMPYSNTYKVGVYSALDGYKYKLEATNIKGNFSGSANFALVLGVTTDAVVMMDSRNGNAEFKGSVITTGTAKHPITQSETLALGKFIINQELHLTADPSTPAVATAEDYLQFCIQLDHDLILDKTVPSAVYIAPPGYTVNADGNVVKIPDGYTAKKDGTLVKNSTVAKA
jgi:hypothetical protein